jgi:MFS family permease
MPALPPSETQRLDVEAALGAAGFTPFHRRAVAITGIAWTFVAMEILLIGFTLPLFGSLWNLSATWLGWIGASALAGSLVGSLLLGRLADQTGRKRIFQASILWYSIFTALTALAWGPTSLLALRFLAGIGLGGMLVVDPSLLAEYLPPQRRGRFLVLLDFFWPIGLLLAIGLSWVFLDRLGGAWRWLFVAAALPAFLAYVARRALPESPYWLARRGRLTEAAGVLGAITGHPVDGDTLAVPHEPSSSPRELFGPRLRATSAVIVLVWVALNVSYYGLFIWLPGVLGAQGTVDLNVYALRGLVMAGGGLGPQAHTGRLPGAGRRQRAHLRARAIHQRVHRRAVLRWLLQPRGLGRGLPLHLRAVPHQAALDRLRHGRGRRQGRRHRRPLPLRLPTRHNRRDRLVAHLRSCRHDRRRAGHPPRPGNTRRQADMTRRRCHRSAPLIGMDPKAPTTSEPAMANP